jgi:3-hydroxyacyl-CoA dehydrogenase/enoyl-CoA hydratase/3-hydroxybutyryl-CoA epimerase
MVIEAVFEQAALKCEVVGRAATFVGRNAILASNTSTLSISELARACPQQARFVGIHFFSPVERMPLVEVIRGKRTEAAALAMALDLAAQLGKTPIIVNDSPGFFTSRVFGAFVDEGMAMLTEGVEPAAIENAARMAGMPVGPLAVCDEVSIELQLRVHGAAVASRLPERFQRLTAIEVVRAMIARDRSGRRAGAGFYDYPPGQRKRLWPGLRELFPVAAMQPPVAELRSRFLVIQALETVRCVEEGVIDATLDADVGSILGIGYPSWTGGTLSYVDTLGLPAFLAACDALVRKVGARFRPSRAFRARAAAGHGFHGPEALR